METVFEYNKKKIQNLLNELKYYKDTLNPNEFNSEFVTGFIRKYGLKSKDLENGKIKNIEEINERLEQKLRNKSIKAVPVYSWLNIWTRDRTIEEDVDFIKLYCSIDSEHVEKGIELIMDFMKKNNILHESKVFNVTRSDNVVIRLKKDDYVGAKKVIDFINNCEYLRNGMNDINPLTPSIGYVGCTTDLDIYNQSKITFNKSSSDMLLTYVKHNENMSVEGFKQFLVSEKRNIFTSATPLYDNVFDTSLIEKINSVQIENNISPETPRKNIVNTLNNCFNKLSKIKPKLSKKQMEMKESSVVIETEIEYLLENAISVTMVNHGAEQAIETISKLLNGDRSGYAYISRNYTNSNRLENYRNLVSNLSCDDIKGLLSRYKDYDNPAEQYVTDIINKKISIINEIYSATLKKHPDSDVVIALKEYAEEGKTVGFTNDNRNLRGTLKYVPREEIIYFIKCHLVQLGYDISVLDDETILYTYDAIVRDRIELDKQR